MTRFALDLTIAATLIGGIAWQATVVGNEPVRQGLAVLSPVEQGTEPQLHEGLVVSAGAGQVSLRTAAGKEHAFKTNSMTRINVNGKPGKLEDLKPGVQIRVMVDAKGMVASVSTVDDRKTQN